MTAKSMSAVFVVMLAAVSLLFVDRERALVDVTPVPRADATQVPTASTLHANDAPSEVIDLAASENPDATENPTKGSSAEQAATTWTIEWNIVDQDGNLLEAEHLLNAGVFTHAGSSGTLTISDTTGSTTASEMNALDNLDMTGALRTQLVAPVQATLRIGHVTFEGVARNDNRRVSLRATGPLDLPGAGYVTFIGSAPIHTVDATEVERLTRRWTLRPVGSEGPLTAAFVPGQYRYSTETDGYPRVGGEFTIHESEHLTVHVQFVEPASLFGQLVPPPAQGEFISIKAFSEGTPWSRKTIRVSADGSFTAEDMAPGRYAFLTIRHCAVEPALSPSMNEHDLYPGENVVTIMDPVDLERGIVTLRTPRGSSANVTITDTRGTQIADHRLRAPSRTRFELAYGDYAYQVIGVNPDAPFVLEGTFTISIEPTEIEVAPREDYEAHAR